MAAASLWASTCRVCRGSRRGTEWTMRAPCVGTVLQQQAASPKLGLQQGLAKTKRDGEGTGMQYVLSMTCGYITKLAGRCFAMHSKKDPVVMKKCSTRCRSAARARCDYVRQLAGR
mmetsp:Transcript_127846/g.408785  ORF Transcript_127846/g.408785 Transcript_127846/m.408785 type:complete len:116 (-) Transcript_127846:85-432(-)